MVDIDDIDENELLDGGWQDNFTNVEFWAPGTTFRLANVPWDSTYKDTVDFTSHEAVISYLENRASRFFRINRATHVRPGEPIRVSIPNGMMIHYNYIHVHSPQQPVSNSLERDYFYFILDTREISPNTTELLVQLDVWTTYKPYVQFGICYLEQGHAGIANQPNDEVFTDHLKRYLTVPEGHDLGSEYNILRVRRNIVGDVGEDGMSVLVWSTVKLWNDTDSENYGTLDDPKLYSAGGTNFEGIPNGAEPYVFGSREDFVTWMDGMSDKPWITQGIIAVYAIPHHTRYQWDLDDRLMAPPPNEIVAHRDIDMLENWVEEIRDRLPAKYQHLDKFFTYPYCVIELTTNTGAPIMLKPEQWRNDDATIREFTYLGQPSPRITFMPLWYNTYGYDGPGYHDGGEYLDVTTGIYDLPTFSVVNNGYMSFIASNRHSIRSQYSSADWSQQKALRSADTGYDQAMMGIDASQQSTDENIRVMGEQQTITDNHAAGRTAMQAGTSLGMGIAGGTPMSIAGGALSAATSVGSEAIARSERSAMTGLQQSSARNQQRIQSNLGQGVADSNLSLSRYSARGDYQNQVGAINAKVQDAQLTQPSISGQQGGEAFNLSKDQWSLDMKIKMVHMGVVRTIGDMWLRYGYKVNTNYIPYTLSVMSHFSYWKFTEATLINTYIPERYKQAFRGILEKGVTVWVDPDDIGFVAPENNTPVYDHYY